MRHAELLPELESGRAVRWLGLHWLREAEEAHGRLGDHRDPEALHDFRVAARRLRSTLRAYRRELRPRVRGRHRRRLRALAEATGQARDVQVQLAWLTERAPRTRGAERTALRWLETRRSARLPEAEARAAEALDGFPRLRRTLERRLRRYRGDVHPDDPRGGPPFRRTAAEHLEAAAGSLMEALAAVEDVTRQDEAHRARILAKRVRYLLEPLSDAIPGGREAVREVRRLQDALGDMHDLHLLWQECGAGMDQPDAPPGLEAVLRRLSRERQAAFAAVRAGWLGGAAAGLKQRLDEAARALAGPGEDREVERKYLLKGFPSLAGLQATELRVAQGYLPGSRLVERVRRVRGPDGEQFFRTVKLGSGVSRLEVEEPCDAAVFHALWRLTRGRRVSKVRYRVPHQGLVWEIDRFHGRRLVLAEVELPHEDAEVILPPWLAAVMDREVTGEAAYVNLNLAR